MTRILIALVIGQWNSSCLERVEEEQIIGRFIAGPKSDLNAVTASIYAVSINDVAKLDAYRTTIRS